VVEGRQGGLRCSAGGQSLISDACSILSLLESCSALQLVRPVPRVRIILVRAYSNVEGAVPNSRGRSSPFFQLYHDSNSPIRLPLLNATSRNDESRVARRTTTSVSLDHPKLTSLPIVLLTSCRVGVIATTSAALSISLASPLACSPCVGRTFFPHRSSSSLIVWKAPVHALTDRARGLRVVGKIAS
jgi:hypothetical protein